MKMRNIFILGFVLVGIAGAVIYVFTRPLSSDLEHYFPSKLVFYSRMNNVALNFETFIKGDFYSKMSSIDYIKVLEKNNVSKDKINDFKQLKKELGLYVSSPIVQKLLGNEVAIGVYLKTDSENKVVGNDVLFATRLSASYQLAEVFLNMAKEWSDDLVTTNSEYLGIKITHVLYKKKKISFDYLRIKDVLFITQGQSKLLNEVIAIYKQYKQGLDKQNTFKRVVSRMDSKSQGYFYLNMEEIAQFTVENITSKSNADLKYVNDAIKGMKSYLFSFSSFEAMKFQLLLDVDPKQVNPWMKSYLECSAKTNASIKFAPHNVLAYQWADCNDYNIILESIAGQKNIDKQAKQSLTFLKQTVQKKLNIDIRKDVIENLGSQFGWYLSDIDTQGNFPYPRFVFFMNFKNRSLGEDLMKKFDLTPIGAMQKEPYQQNILKYFSLPFGVNMDLGYTFIEDYLLIGTSRQLLKTSIDAYNNPDQSLISNQTLSADLKIGTLDNKNLAYFNTEVIVARLEQLLDWYNKVVSSQITAATTYQREGENHRKEIKGLIDQKKEELLLAQQKLNEQKAKELPAEATQDDITIHKENVEHLASDVTLVTEDIKDLNKQSKELDLSLKKYANQAEASKLWLFNSDELFKPILMSLKTIKSVSMRSFVLDNVIESDIFLK